MMDSTLSYFLKSFKLRSKQISAEEAVKATGGMAQFFAVELHYKGSPIRLIVAASALPDEIKNPLTEKRELAAASPSAVVGEG